MRFVARTFAILMLLGAAATPAGADTAARYCLATVAYNLPVTGQDSQEAVCEDGTRAICEQAGATSGFPAVFVKVCVRVG